MYLDDRVLVAVINRRRDLVLLHDELCYRIPIFSAPLCIATEYMAFYLSRAFAEMNGAIHFYARRTGFELVRRRDLLPGEFDHPRAEALYFKLQFRSLERKLPPIGNPTRRPISFIYTTWERFSRAQTVTDLYQHHSANQDTNHG